MDQTVKEDDLQRNNGQEGRPAYVAVDGKVYDVSNSRMWKGGQHMRRHDAGKDLTDEIAAAPHDKSVLERVQAVGTLEPKKEAAPVPTVPVGLRWLFDLGPRPHPVSVHFPVAWVAGTGILALIFLFTKNQLFDIASYYVLWMGVVITPLTTLLGVLSWWYLYGRIQNWKFNSKILLATLLMLVGAFTLFLRAKNAQILVTPGPARWGYIVLLVILVLIVAALGWIGDLITFPRKRKK